MKPLKMMLSAAAILVATVTVNAQTADDIINKHLDAVGGKNLLEQVKSIVIESSINAMGNDAPATTTVVAGKGYKMQTEMMGQQVVQAMTDKGGWAISPQGGGTAQAMPDDQYKMAKNQLNIDPFLDYATRGDKVALIGSESGAYKITLISSDNATATYYIDSVTYYITKVIKTVNMMGNDMDLTVTLSDHKKTDFGIVMAYTQETAFGTMFSMTATTKKVTFNGDIDPKVFDMPK